MLLLTEERVILTEELIASAKKVNSEITANLSKEESTLLLELLQKIDISM